MTLSKSWFMSKARGQGVADRIARGRWAYYWPVRNLIRHLQEETREAGREWGDVLELGPGLDPVWPEATTMGMKVKGEPSPDIEHDATTFPWPPASKSFQVFVALQVFEHLRGRQVDAFREVQRITTGTAIISIPYEWNISRIRDHVGLNHQTMMDWTGREPDLVIHTVRRAIYVYHFDRDGIADLPGAL